MKIGVQTYITAYSVDPVTLGRALEQAGFDSYWAPEHATIPVKPAVPFPMGGGEIPAIYGQMVDPFVSLSVMSTATSTLKLVTGVCLVPERHPLALAKTVSSLDFFSGGRVIFGAGTGWLPEVTAHFTPHADKPWKVTLESIEAMKGLWSTGSAAFDGEIFSFPEMVCDPLPVQRPHPPIVIGARPTPVGLRRVARHADGMYLTLVTPDDVAQARKTLVKECEAIGRNPAEIELSVSVHDPSPSVQRMFEDAGADRLVILMHNHDGEPLPMDDWLPRQIENIFAPPQEPADTLRTIEKLHDLARL